MDFQKLFLRDVVLVAIFHPDSAVWRLTFTSFDFKDGKIIANTNRKRFTYVLGKNISVKTAQQQMRLLEATCITQQIMEEIFNVEKVSKAFFSDYKILYKKVTVFLKNSFYFESEIERNTFAKKLLGRIVFLYFLQKKGWLGSTEKWGDGKKNFISHLFKKRANHGNFYNDILEAIFFDALNVDRRAYNDYFELLKCKMPFLNGGLFTRDIVDTIYKHEKYALDNELISEIIETFDRYNFTIIEGTPHESEVAIDPEMLGHVFEELLEDRKDSGAFYTPKEVVHYMCQQAIISYLSNDFESNAIEGLVIHENIESKYIKTHKEDIIKKLNSIKILDPAIGSGAFPMGMLHEIVNIILLLKPSIENIAQLKREIVQNSIYGIDIEYSAVEIAKLRFWLSMVVDEETPVPLPNLYYKIMVGNSLIETIIDGKKSFDPLSNESSSLFNPNEEKINEVQHLLKEFYSIEDHAEKAEHQEKLEKKIDGILDNKLKEKRKEAESQREAINLFTGLTKKQAQIIEDANNTIAMIEKVKKRPTTELFFYKIYFAEVLNKGGFDVVIGNPPYIMEDENKEAFKGLHIQPCYQGKTDIWHLFTCKGIELLKEGGVITYIAKNQWLSSASASHMRKTIYADTSIQSIVDFGTNMIFENADQQTMIFLLKKDSRNSSHKIRYIKFEEQINRIDMLQNINKHMADKERLFISQKEIDKQFDEKDNLTFSTLENERILAKIDKKKNFHFDEKKEIIQGIIGGPDKAFIVSKDNLSKFEKKEKSYFKMLHTNTGKYFTEDTEKYICYISKHNFKEEEIKSYPQIENMLLPYKSYIDKKGKQKGLLHRREVLNGSIGWMHLWWARDESFFEKGAKIIFTSRTKGKTFTYTQKAFYGTRNLFFIKSNRVSLKYITALLNSNLMYFYMHERLKHTGDLLQIDKNQFMKIPLFVPENIKKFENLVDKIITLKEKGEKAQFFEDKIDKMFYKLYGLNDTEIKRVEES